jgi:chemotaxis protein CheC
VIDVSDPQRDALIELINIGFGRAAASLSQLTGYRVILEVPQVAIHPLSELKDVLGQVVKGEVASVHQVFSGPVAGDALLVLDASGAALINQLLTGEAALPGLDSSAREVITEVGNILLNACLGMFGNLLRVHVSFSVPSLTLDTLGDVLDSVAIHAEDVHDIRYALIVHAGFRIREGSVTGYMIIVLGVSSLHRLLLEVDLWQTGRSAT